MDSGFVGSNLLSPQAINATAQKLRAIIFFTINTSKKLSINIYFFLEKETFFR